MLGNDQYPKIMNVAINALNSHKWDQAYSNHQKSKWDNKNKNNKKGSDLNNSLSNNNDSGTISINMGETKYATVVERRDI